ncbi:WD repeat-containing protein 34 [Homalodisca vitripennis]|nr:WD repeat-containing protein 34 [Homalodisca vitripennis]
MFVVALEGGALHHCSASAAKPVASEHLVKDPVISSFEPQPATVTCVEFSPHHDDVFATVSTDQTIRIYSLFQRRAEREICGVGSLVGLCWAPAQAHVLAGWGDQAVVSLYNSHTGDTLSALTPDNTENKAHISAAAFNTKSYNTCRSAELSFRKLLVVSDIGLILNLFLTLGSLRYGHKALI